MHLNRGITVRKIATCAMTVVLIATLLWGGCLSCSQYFMFPAVAANDCCAPSGHCKDGPARPSTNECRLQPVALVHQQAVPDHAVSIALTAVQMPPLLEAPGFLRAGPIARAGSISHSPPPDLLVLHSVFRI